MSDMDMMWYGIGFISGAPFWVALVLYIIMERRGDKT